MDTKMNVFDQEKWIENLKYAGIIQRSVLPQSKNIEQIASEHAVMYEPLEYVSGDFFWTANKEPFQYLAVGDCTGHGVPAAMLSLFVLNQLEYLVMNKMLINTSQILHEIDHRFIESFHGQKDYLYNTEWIDISLVCINRMKNELYFSSANRKILIVKSNGETIVLKGNNFPIGGWQFTDKRDFSVQITPFEKGDLLYLGSDGFQNQLGGEKTKKFGSNRLHEFFQQHASYHLRDQFKLLKEEYERWKGSNEQTDDICLLGVRL